MADLPALPTPPSDLATEADVEQLVRAFYAAARTDDVLGPVFAAAQLDWDAHIPRVTAFWCWQLLGGRRYDGRPLRSHQRADELVSFTEAHYERWLALFGATLHDRWQGPIAELAERRARRMAASMRRVLAGVDDPDPTWAEEGVEPEGPAAGGGGGAEGGPGRGVVMRVALGAPRRRPSGDGTGPEDPAGDR